MIKTQKEINGCEINQHDVRYVGTNENDVDGFRCHTCYPTLWDYILIFFSLFRNK